MTEMMEAEPMEFRKPLTALEIKAQVNLIQQVMESVMKEGAHYGKIPGCGDQPALFKAGAEKLLMTFRVAPLPPRIEDLSTEDEIRYRLTIEGVSAVTGKMLGAGVGECSSYEDKYKWRRAVCDEEWNETPEDRRRQKWFRGKEKPFQVKQIRTNKADVANTVLKMADKRAYVALALKVTAASDIFTQDLEDMDDTIRETVADSATASAPVPAMPARKSVPPAPPEPAIPAGNGTSRSGVDRSTMKPMTSKYPGKCAECGLALEVGDMVYYDGTTKKVYCSPKCEYVPA